jgi:murein DD-endopeptidase MepM/ murein hydrolase activator NlpD
MPGGVTAGWAGDTGLDLASPPRDVFAIAAGVLEYSEGGHTRWKSKQDSPYAIRLRLDQPLAHGDRRVTHVWYAHLSAIVSEIHEGDPPVRVEAGQKLGTSGTANGCAHLHLGMLLDGDVEQDWSGILQEDAVREVLCGVAAKVKLPESS